jgi:hypothetical protein
VSTADSGYAIFRSVFAPARMKEICDALESVDLHRTKAGARRVLRVRAVQTLATEPDLLSLAGQFLDDRPIPFRATLFDKSATSNWLVGWYRPRRVLHIEYAVSVHIAPASSLPLAEADDCRMMGLA